MKTFCQNFAQLPKRLNNEAVVVKTLVALAELGCHDADAIAAAKRYILGADLELGNALLVGWALSLLNGFDEDTVKWWMTNVAKANAQNTTDIEQRHLYQTLMHIYVLQSEFGRHLDVDPQFEEICLENWRAHIKKKAYTSQAVLQMFISLRELGLYCFRQDAAFGRRFNISTIMHKDFPQRICIVCVNGFWNARHRQRGPHMWKQNMLKQLGWLIIKIGIDDWDGLKTAKERREFLRSNVAAVLEQRIAKEKKGTILESK